MLNHLFQEQGNLFIWGKGSNGQLANLDSSSQSIQEDFQDIPKEVSMNELKGKVKGAICKKTYTSILTTNGNIIIMGTIDTKHEDTKSQNSSLPKKKQKNQIQYSWQSFVKMYPQDEWGGCAVTKKGDIIFWNKYFMTEKFAGKSQIDDISIIEGKLFALQKECLLEWDLDDILRNSFFSSKQRSNLDRKFDLKSYPPKEYQFLSNIKNCKFLNSSDGKSLGLYVECESNKVFTEKNSFLSHSKGNRDTSFIIGQNKTSIKEQNSPNSFFLNSSIEQKSDFLSPDRGFAKTSLISPKNNIPQSGFQERPLNNTRPQKTFLGNVEKIQNTSNSSSPFNPSNDLQKQFKGMAGFNYEQKISEEFKKVKDKFGWKEQFDKSVDLTGHKVATEESYVFEDTQLPQRIKTFENSTSQLGGHFRERVGEVKSQINKIALDFRLNGTPNKQNQAQKQEQVQYQQPNPQVDQVKRQKKQQQGNFNQIWEQISKKPQEKQKSSQNDSQLQNGKDLRYFLSLIQQSDQPLLSEEQQEQVFRQNNDSFRGNSYLKNELPQRNNTQRNKGFLNFGDDQQQRQQIGSHSQILNEDSLFNKQKVNSFLNNFKQISRQNETLKIDLGSSFTSNKLNQSSIKRKNDLVSPYEAAQKGFYFIDANGCRIEVQSKGHKSRDLNESSQYIGSNSNILTNSVQYGQRSSQRQAIYKNRNDFERVWSALNNKGKDELNRSQGNSKNIMNSFYSDRQLQAARSLDNSALDPFKRQTTSALNISARSIPRSFLGEITESRQNKQDIPSSQKNNRIERNKQTLPSQNINILDEDPQLSRSQSPSFSKNEQVQLESHQQKRDNNNLSSNSNSQNYFDPRRGSFGIQTEENEWNQKKSNQNNREEEQTPKLSKKPILPIELQTQVQVAAPKEQSTQQCQTEDYSIQTNELDLLQDDENKTPQIIKEPKIKVQEEPLTKSNKFQELKGSNPAEGNPKREDEGTQVDLINESSISESRARKASIGNQTAFSDEEMEKSRSKISQLQLQLEEKLSENEKLKSLMKQKELQESFRQNKRRQQSKDSQTASSHQIQQGKSDKKVTNSIANAENKQDNKPQQSECSQIHVEKSEIEINQEENNVNQNNEKIKSQKEGNDLLTEGSILDLSCSEVEDMRRDEQEDEGEFDDINPVLLSQEELGKNQTLSGRKRDILNDHPDFLDEEEEDENEEKQAKENQKTQQRNPQQKDSKENSTQSLKNQKQQKQITSPKTQSSTQKQNNLSKQKAHEVESSPTTTEFNQKLNNEEGNISQNFEKNGDDDNNSQEEQQIEADHESQEDIQDPINLDYNQNQRNERSELDRQNYDEEQEIIQEEQGESFEENEQIDNKIQYGSKNLQKQQNQTNNQMNEDQSQNSERNYPREQRSSGQEDNNQSKQQNQKPQDLLERSNNNLQTTPEINSSQIASQLKDQKDQVLNLENSNSEANKDKLSENDQENIEDDNQNQRDFNLNQDQNNNNLLSNQKVSSQQSSQSENQPTSQRLIITQKDQDHLAESKLGIINSKENENLNQDQSPEAQTQSNKQGSRNSQQISNPKSGNNNQMSNQEKINDQSESQNEKRELDRETYASEIKNQATNQSNIELLKQNQASNANSKSNLKDKSKQQLEGNKNEEDHFESHENIESSSQQNQKQSSEQSSIETTPHSDKLLNQNQTEDDLQNQNKQQNQDERFEPLNTKQQSQEPQQSEKLKIDESSSKIQGKEQVSSEVSEKSNLEESTNKIQGKEKDVQNEERNQNLNPYQQPNKVEEQSKSQQQDLQELKKLEDLNFKISVKSQSQLEKQQPRDNIVGKEDFKQEAEGNQNTEKLIKNDDNQSQSNNNEQLNPEQQIKSIYQQEKERSLKKQNNSISQQVSQANDNQPQQIYEQVIEIESSNLKETIQQDSEKQIIHSQKSKDSNLKQETKSNQSLKQQNSDNVSQNPEDLNAEEESTLSKQESSNPSQESQQNPNQKQSIDQIKDLQQQQSESTQIKYEQNPTQQKTQNQESSPTKLESHQTEEPNQFENEQLINHMNKSESSTPKEVKNESLSSTKFQGEQQQQQQSNAKPQTKSEQNLDYQTNLEKRQEEDKKQNFEGESQPKLEGTADKIENEQFQASNDQRRQENNPQQQTNQVIKQEEGSNILKGSPQDQSADSSKLDEIKEKLNVKEGQNKQENLNLSQNKIQDEEEEQEIFNAEQKEQEKLSEQTHQKQQNSSQQSALKQSSEQNEEFKSPNNDQMSKINESNQQIQSSQGISDKQNDENNNQIQNSDQTNISGQNPKDCPSEDEEDSGIQKLNNVVLKEEIIISAETDKQQDQINNQKSNNVNEGNINIKQQQELNESQKREQIDPASEIQITQSSPSELISSTRLPNLKSEDIKNENENKNLDSYEQQQQQLSQEKQNKNQEGDEIEIPLKNRIEARQEVISKEQFNQDSQVMTQGKQQYNNQETSPNNDLIQSKIDTNQTSINSSQIKDPKSQNQEQINLQNKILSNEESTPININIQGHTPQTASISTPIKPQQKLQKQGNEQNISSSQSKQEDLQKNSTNFDKVNDRQALHLSRSLSLEESRSLIQSQNSLRQSYDPQFLSRQNPSQPVSNSNIQNSSRIENNCSRKSNDSFQRQPQRSNSLRYSDICENFEKKMKKAHYVEKNKAIERATGTKISQYSDSNKNSLNNSVNRSGVTQSLKNSSVLKKSETNFLPEDLQQKQELHSFVKQSQDSFNKSFEPNDPQLFKSNSSPRDPSKLRDSKGNNADSLILAAGAISPIPNSYKGIFSPNQFIQEEDHVFQEIKEIQVESPKQEDKISEVESKENLSSSNHQYQNIDHSPRNSKSENQQKNDNKEDNLQDYIQQLSSESISNTIAIAQESNNLNDNADNNNLIQNASSVVNNQKETKNNLPSEIPQGQQYQCNEKIVSTDIEKEQKKDQPMQIQQNESQTNINNTEIQTQKSSEQFINDSKVRNSNIPVSSKKEATNDQQQKDNQLNTLSEQPEKQNDQVQLKEQIITQPNQIRKEDLQLDSQLSKNEKESDQIQKKDSDDVKDKLINSPQNNRGGLSQQQQQQIDKLISNHIIEVAQGSEIQSQNPTSLISSQDLKVEQINQNTKSSSFKEDIRENPSQDRKNEILKEDIRNKQQSPSQDQQNLEKQQFNPVESNLKENIQILNEAENDQEGSEDSLLGKEFSSIQEVQEAIAKLKQSTPIVGVKDSYFKIDPFKEKPKISQDSDAYIEHEEWAKKQEILERQVKSALVNIQSDYNKSPQQSQQLQYEQQIINQLINQENDNSPSQNSQDEFNSDSGRKQNPLLDQDSYDKQEQVENKPIKEYENKKMQKVEEQNKPSQSTQQDILLKNSILQPELEKKQESKKKDEINQPQFYQKQISSQEQSESVSPINSQKDNQKQNEEAEKSKSDKNLSFLEFKSQEEQKKQQNQNKLMSPNNKIEENKTNQPIVIGTGEQQDFDLNKNNNNNSNDKFLKDLNSQISSSLKGKSPFEKQDQSKKGKNVYQAYEEHIEHHNTSYHSQHFTQTEESVDSSINKSSFRPFFDKNNLDEEGASNVKSNQGDRATNVSVPQNSYYSSPFDISNISKTIKNVSLDKNPDSMNTQIQKTDIPSRKAVIADLCHNELMVLPPASIKENSLIKQISENSKVGLVLALKTEKFQLKRKFQVFQKLRLHCGILIKQKSSKIEEIPINILRFKGQQITKAIQKILNIKNKPIQREFLLKISQNIASKQNLQPTHQPKLNQQQISSIQKRKIKFPHCLMIFCLRRLQFAFENLKYWDNSLRPTIDQNQYFIDQKNLNQMRPIEGVDGNNYLMQTPEKKNNRQDGNNQKLQKATSDSPQRLAAIQQKARTSQQQDQVRKSQQQQQEQNLKSNFSQNQKELKQSIPSINKILLQDKKQELQQDSPQKDTPTSYDIEQQGYKQLLNELESHVNEEGEKNVEEDNCDKPQFAPDYADPKEFEPDSFRKFAKNLSQEEQQMIEQLLPQQKSMFSQNLPQKKSGVNSGSSYNINNNFDGIDFEIPLSNEGSNQQHFEKYLNQFNLNLSQSQSNPFSSQKLKGSNSQQLKEDNEQEGEQILFLNHTQSQNYHQSSYYSPNEDMKYFNQSQQYALIPEKLQPGYIYKEKNKLLRVAPIVNYTDVGQGAVNDKKLNEQSLNNPPAQSLPGYDKVINSQKQFIAKKFKNLHKQRVTGSQIIQSPNQTSMSPPLPLNSSLNTPSRNQGISNSMIYIQNASSSILQSPKSSIAQNASNRLYENAVQKQQRQSSEQPKQSELKFRQSSHQHSNSFQSPPSRSSKVKK